MAEQEKNTEQGVHKRRARYKGKYPRKFEEKYKEITAGKIPGYHCTCHSEGKYTCRNAHFNHGAGDPGFSEDSARRDWI